jgi:uncharacterized membrane protein YsdA (DUF1294 family)
MPRSRPPLLEGSRFAFLLALVSATALGVLVLLGHVSPVAAVGLHVLLTSILAFLVFGWDKRRARGEGRRISEANLLWLSLLGGGPGAWWAMRRLRHKTQKRMFQIVVPVAALLWIAALAWLAWRALFPPNA